MSTVEGRMNYR